MRSTETPFLSIKESLLCFKHRKDQLQNCTDKVLSGGLENNNHQSNRACSNLPARLFIASFSALFFADPYRRLKLWQNKLQYPNASPTSKYAGLHSSAMQQQLRFLWRLGAAPCLSFFAMRHHPAFMSDQAAGQLALILSSTAIEAVIAPFERMSNAKQTYLVKGEAQEPSFRLWRDTLIPKDQLMSRAFIKKAYQGNSIAIMSKIPLLTLSTLSKPVIDSYTKDENGHLSLGQQILNFSMLAGVMAGTNWVLTPMSEAQQRMQRHYLPAPTARRAFEKTLKNGISEPIRRSGKARLTITAVSSLWMSATAYAINMVVDEFEKQKNEQKGRSL